jgi:hypothetical protein
MQVGAAPRSCRGSLGQLLCEVERWRLSKGSARGRIMASSIARQQGTSSSAFACRYVLPLQYSNTLVPAMDLLICGWGSDSLMWELLQQLDHGLQALPAGACVTLLNDHSFTDFGEPERYFISWS